MHGHGQVIASGVFFVFFSRNTAREKKHITTARGTACYTHQCEESVSAAFHPPENASFLFFLLFVLLPVRRARNVEQQRPVVVLLLLLVVVVVVVMVVRPGHGAPLPAARRRLRRAGFRSHVARTNTKHNLISPNLPAFFFVAPPSFASLSRARTHTLDAYMYIYIYILRHARKQSSRV